MGRDFDRGFRHRDWRAADWRGRDWRHRLGHWHPWRGGLWPRHHFWFSWFPFWNTFFPQGGFFYDYYDFYGYSPVVATQYFDTYVAPLDPIPVEAPAVDYYTSAVTAFQAGNFEQAARLASQAAIADPRDGDVHELLSLSLFALGDYRSAAVHAHAAAELERISTWPSIWEYYRDREVYTAHLNELIRFANGAPGDPAAQFLTGYHLLALGHDAMAQDFLGRAVDLTPEDNLARYLLEESGGLPPEPPR